MEHSLFERARHFLNVQRKKKIWYRAMYGMAAIVVFITTYMLILPAITMERETICGKEEHTHTDECYTTEVIEIEQEPVLICTVQTLEIHKHTESCYTRNENGEKVLTCDQADFVLHVHDDNCYNEEGSLVCTFDEVEEHVHDSNCYKTEQKLVCEKEESKGHSHTEDCYKKERGSLICDAEEHKHGEICYDADGNLICKKEEHQHTDECYKWEEKLVCGKEESEGHTHGEGCYETVQTLICDKQEAYVHKHTDSCYKNSVLACGKLETAEHQHSETCFETPEPETEEKVTLVCEKEEHVHEDGCFADETEVVAASTGETAGSDVSDEAESQTANESTAETDESVSEADEGTAETENNSYNVMESDDTSCIVYKAEAEDENADNDSVSVSTFSLRTASATAVSDDAGVDFGSYITGVSISKLVNGSWQSATEFTDGDIVNVSIAYAIPAGKVTADNKVIYYQLPDGIRPLEEAEGIVYQGGQAVGTYVIGMDGMITITFYDEFADGREFTGNIQFKGTVIADGADSNGKIEFGGTGGSITIVPEKEEYDISVKKSGTVSNDKETVDYSIVASTNNGTAGNTVTITDQFGTSTATAVYKEDSIKVYKVDTNGTRTEVPNNSYNLAFSNDNSNFEITGLPALKAGESYEVEYTADVDVTEDDGAGTVVNSACAKTDTLQKWTYNQLEISKSILEKSGYYDQNTGYINWTIVVNKEKLDISGYTLSDIIPGNLKIAGDVVIKDSNGTETTVSPADSTKLEYRFADNSTDTYTITFKTTAPENDETVSNSVNLEKTGNESYSDSVDIWVTHRIEYDVLKYYNGTTTDNNLVTRYKWYSSVTLPEKKISTFTYTDEILPVVDGDGQAQSGSHYAIRSELQKAIEDNIKLYLKDGRTVSYNNDICTFAITYYDAGGNSITDDTVHVAKFKITVNAKEGTSFEAYKMEVSYSTIADYSGMETGETWTFKNTGSVDTKISTGSVDYTKPKPLEKSAGIYNSESNYTTWYGDGTTVDLDATNGILYYRILIRTEPGNNGAITVTDTLPVGATYVEGSLKAVFYNNDYSTYPTIYWYPEGRQQEYSLETEVTSTVKDGVLTVTIPDGYNSDSTGTSKGNIIQLTYQVSVKNDASWNDLLVESQSYTNKVQWGNNSDEVTTKVEREVEKVSKTGSQVIGADGKATNQVEYQVVINPAGDDLDPNSETLTLIDTLTTYDSISGAYLDLGSLALYKYDATKEGYLGDVIDSNKYVVQYDEITHKMTVTLPDKLACVLVYRYTVDRGSVNTPTLINSASLKGEFSNQFSFTLKEVDSSASVEKSKVTIFKVDANDYTKRLEGAEFEFSFFDTTEGKWIVVGTATTNENGEFILQDQQDQQNQQDQQDVKNLWVGTNFLYRLEEVTAPDGYSKSDKVYYFALMPKDTTLDQFYDTIGGNAAGVNKDQIQIFGSAGGSLYIPNEFTRIWVRKEWVDQAGDTIAAPVDSINVQLKQHLKKPDGCTVTINVKYIKEADWSTGVAVPTSYDTITKQILVEKGTNIIITINDAENASNIAGYTIEKGGESFGTVKCSSAEWGHAIFTTNAITENCTIDICCGWCFNDPTVEYTSPSSYTDGGVTDYGASVTLDASNSWSYSWDGLPKEDGNGNLYYYTVEENTQLNGYTTTYVNNNGIQTGEIVVVNTKDAEKEPEYSLPETGGPGKIQYILDGVLLMLASILMYIKKVKSREGKRI